ncbi:MAG: hypothetical protein LLF28_07705 [Nitrospiraceae bacterium]|nr:hypothetical protein [Nitrospiraceae bacterium]
MEPTLKIIMQCPKCLKEFSLDTGYCESCSVMLEPIEMQEQDSSEKKAVKKKTLKDDLRGEKLEDVKIDSLKADIESKFISALLHEKFQLEKRLANKQKTFTELQGKKSDMDYSDYINDFEKKETEIDDIAKKTEKIKAMLYNLKRKVEADISNLVLKINNIPKQSFFWFLTANGRYRDMLVSELNVKKALMNIMSGKKSRHYFRLKKIKRIFFLFLFSVLISLGISFYFIANFYREQVQIISGTQKENISKASIEKEHVIALLEDIKSANFRGDIKLWESRYTKQYLKSQNRRQQQIEQWKRFNFKALDYKLVNLTQKGDKASGVIVWNMELISKGKKQGKIITQKLYADFILENGMLKISSVRKE